MVRPMPLIVEFSPFIPYAFSRSLNYLDVSCYISLHSIDAGVVFPVFFFFRMIRDLPVRLLLILFSLNIVRHDGIVCSASDHYPRCESRCPPSRRLERQACLLSCAQEYSSLMYRTKMSQEDDKRRPPLNRQMAIITLIQGLRKLQEMDNKKAHRLRWPTGVHSYATAVSKRTFGSFGE